VMILRFDNFKPSRPAALIAESAVAPVEEVVADATA